MLLWVVYLSIYEDDGLLGVFDNQQAAHAAAVGAWRWIEVWTLNGPKTAQCYYLSPDGRQSDWAPR